MFSGVKRKPLLSPEELSLCILQELFIGHCVEYNEDEDEKVYLIANANIPHYVLGGRIGIIVETDKINSYTKYIDLDRKEFVIEAWQEEIQEILAA